MTLTETAKFTKRFLFFFVIFLIVLAIVWGGSLYSKRYLYSKIPIITEKPDLKFALLPRLKIPNPNVTSSNFSYSLDTPTGALPEKLPTAFKIYAIPQLGNTFLAADKARELAKKFNLDSNPEILSPTVHKFTNSNGAEFTIDINTGNFSYKRPIATQSATQNEQLKDLPNISQQFKSFLTQKEIMPTYLKNGEIKTDYLAAINPEQLSTLNISLWQEKIDDYKIVTEKFTKGLVEAVLVGSADDINNYLSLDYTYWPIDTKNFAVYPIRSVDQAFKDLKSGEATIVIEPKTSQVSISSVYLAYFLSKSYPEYLQPVYVFEGQNFAALVQAVVKPYLKDQ